MKQTKIFEPTTTLIFFIIVILLFFSDLTLVLFGLEYTIVWKFLEYLFILGILLLITFLFKKCFSTELVSSTKFAGTFLESTKSLFYLLIFYLGLFTLFSILKFYFSSKFLYLFEKEVHFAFSSAFSSFFIVSQLCWLISLKRKNTNKFIIAFLVYLSAYVVFTIFNLEFELFNDSTLIDKLFVLAEFLIIFFAFNMKTWIAIASRHTLKRILLFSFLLFVLLAIYVKQEFRFEIGLSYGNNFFHHFSRTLAIIFIFTFIRAFYLAAISLPLSRIVEKKVYEVNSLSYLSKIVRNFTNLDDICKVITEFSYYSMNNSPSWLIFQNNRTFEIKSSYGVNLNEYSYFLNNFTRELELKEIKLPKIINSIEDFNYSSLNFKSSFQSFCIVPIYVNEKLYGYLVSANKTEYFFDEDDFNLLSSFVEILSIAIENSILMKETIEKEKYRKELMIARNIQLSFLPKEPPRNKYVEIATFIQPSEEVGGDFYDFIELSPDKLLILVGDVSGKGLGAALYMSLLKGIIFANSNQISSAKDFLIRINDSLFSKIDKQIHITISVLFFDFKKQNVEFVRAGHFPAFIKKEDGIEALNSEGIGISLLKSSIFSENLKSKEINFSFGDYFILYTDGLVEILGNKNIIIGIERLKQIIEKEVFSNANELKEKIIDYFNKLGSNIDDDVTLLVVKIKNYSSIVN